MNFILSDRSKSKVHSVDQNNMIDSARSELPQSKRICRLCLKKEELTQPTSIPTHLQEILNLQEQAASDTFIVPCRCEGNFKHAHRECMKMFIMAQNRLLLPKTKCELCKADYSFDFRLKQVLDLSFSRHKSKQQLQESKHNILFLILCLFAYFLASLENTTIGSYKLIFYPSKSIQLIVLTLILMLIIIQSLLLIYAMYCCLIFFDLVDWTVHCQQQEIGLHKHIEQDVKDACMRTLQNEFWQKIDMNAIDIPEWMLAQFDIRLSDSRVTSNGKLDQHLNNLDETVINDKGGNVNNNNSNFLHDESFDNLFYK